MKPTCPTSCPLKEAINQNRESDLMTEEARQIFEQLSSVNLRRVLAGATFLHYRQQGLTKISTWILMAERRRVLYFIWGFFERVDLAMMKGGR